MKIVQISPYDLDRPGGVQRHILALAAALRAHGHEVMVVAPGPAVVAVKNIFYLGRQREIGLSGTRFELTWASRSELALLRKYLVDWKPDILHFHSLWTPLLSFQIFRGWSGPVVATFHDTPPPGMLGDVLRFLFKGISRRILRRIDGAIVVSRAPLAHMRPGSSGVIPAVLPPGVDLTVTTTAYKEKSAEDGILRFLFVGRLSDARALSSCCRHGNLCYRRRKRPVIARS